MEKRIHNRSLLSSFQSPKNNLNPDSDGAISTYTAPQPRIIFSNPIRVLVIGAGSRGSAYAAAALSGTNTVIAAIAEPIASKRSAFARKFIHPHQSPGPEQEFVTWRDWVKYERVRRERERAGEKVERGVDAIFVCVLDEMHEEVVVGVCKEDFGVHVLCEKPLATTLDGCTRMREAWKGTTKRLEEKREGPDSHGKRREAVFGICHVLRYSPHNMMLRDLVVEQQVVGDLLSIEHVEPVGWWHFSHSYVRGNWRKESVTAPSLLTKSCHDIDFILWMLCSPPSGSTEPHLPSYLTSTGSRKFFRKERKPKEAGGATNCLSCSYEPDCIYSAKKIYLDKHLSKGDTGWPVKIVNPDIEDCYQTSGLDVASKKLLENLAEDYDSQTPAKEVESRPWFGRCVWEADNDVCDDQCVTITWDDDPIAQDEAGRDILTSRGAKTAQFHMIAFTEKICERRGRIYGTKGEIEYDSSTIKVYDFGTGETKEHVPHKAEGGHGGGDEGLVRQFLMAADAVDSQGKTAAEAQREYLGCDLDEAFRSHAMVFAAEEARKQRKVVDWKQWVEAKVEQ